jgi:spore maturation protein B
LTYGIVKKIPVYETFVEGAKDGLRVSVNILPYLTAVIVAVYMLRASGAIELLQRLFSGVFDAAGVPADVLPVMIVRSLSGSAVLGVLSEIVSRHGPDSYAAKLAAVMVGSSETTFYVLSVYFGSVGIKKFRHALLTGIFADAAGIIAAVLVARWLFL